VGVINPPNSTNTLDLFKANAADASGTTNPAAVNGGILVAAAGGTSANASASSGTAATATGTAGSGYGTGYGAATGTSASAAATTSASAGEALRVVRWSELLGMCVAIGGAAVLMQ